MIDTVRFKGHWRIPSGSDWELMVERPMEASSHLPGRIRGHYKNRLVRVFGEGETITSAECSLPRLLNGTNEHLLSSQLEVDASLKSLVGLLGGPVWKLTRLDLVWHFPLSIAEWSRAFKYCQPDFIRKPPTIRRNAVTWSGTECVVEGYDQSKKLHKTPGSYTRVEIRFMRRRQVIRRLGERPKLKIDQCWREYRDILLRLVPEPLLVTKFDVNTPFALADQEGWRTADGQTLFDIWAHGKSAQAVSRKKKAIREHPLTFASIPWRDWLPETIPDPLSSRTEG